ncbi:MAG: hypothetical protein JWO37_15 [Acidimicrobiales bacterium]|jgi:glycosyltransferase involved in cell wall biosynthesis|nr:hypothetical protein [Acidimicrobiales bacterium]
MRAAMLYTWDWSQEFQAFEAGAVPSHRLSGAADLPSFGIEPGYCTWRRVPLGLRRRQLWKIWQAAWAGATQRQWDCFVAATEAAALPVLVLRRLRLIRKPIILLTVAVVRDPYLHGIQGVVRRWLVRGADAVVTYSTSQMPELVRRFRVRPTRLHFVALGIDVKYFEPQPAVPEWDVLAAGTNEGRDYQTLLAALEPNERCLIVTDDKNAVAVTDTPSLGQITIDQAVPIAQLRSLYAAARRVVIPLHDVTFSSGQTTLLENLAMGRPVIVSDVPMIRDYISSDAMTAVPAHDVAALRRALSGPTPPMIPAAVEHVRRHFTADRFGRDLAQLCEAVVNQSNSERSL